MKSKEKLSRDWVEWLKAGLEIAKVIAKKQGYELYFPSVDEMELVKESKKDEK